MAVWVVMPSFPFFSSPIDALWCGSVIHIPKSPHKTRELSLLRLQALVRIPRGPIPFLLQRRGQESTAISISGCLTENKEGFVQPTEGRREVEGKIVRSLGMLATGGSCLDKRLCLRMRIFSLLCRVGDFKPLSMCWLLALVFTEAVSGWPLSMRGH